jgi:ABC-type oligopeptide transport system substrate-binding subunit/transcriptional regulator with XRE-family HTH domain
VGGTANSFGYWVRRRRLALDLTQASLARRVGCSVAAIKKIERDERRPSRTMATRLATALGLAPDQQARFVATGLGELAADRLGETSAAVDPGPAPAWLSTSLGTERRQVVGRDAEVARLLKHLDAARSGKTRMVFVTGEAGQGKTSLLTLFADQAQRAVPDLVVARGAGTAAGGFGDPYLAIRDLFRMLVVDPYAPWHADQLAAEQAQQLWAFAPTVASVISQSGPHLLDVIVPADIVQERLGGGSAPVRTQPSRDHVIAEVTDVLTALAVERPLLLLLDDMQWADTASAELLFHLSKRLTDARVLVVCTYRASEVAEDPGPAAATVRRTLLETSRRLDDTHIDLDAIAPDAERDLCDALLDLEFPDLEPALRDAIYERTHGSPLFVLELVRELKARGDLIRRPDGSWTARDGLDWAQLPARVAVVIEQRLDRLAPDERTLLEAAAVEGEQFTAETAAQVAGIDERAAHRLLSRQLDRVQALVRETGTVRIAGSALTSYRFSHALFQRFVYDSLGEGSRRSAHRQVATELERLYAADPEPVLSQLAHHYAAAGAAERAVPYLLQAGDRARLLYAHDEAIGLYDRAAEFLRELGDQERLARTEMKVGLTHQTGFDHDRAQRAFDRAFALWAAVDPGPDHVSGSATLRLIWNEPASLDPTMGGYTTTAPVVTNLLSGLVRYDEGTNVVPDVARRWEISGDGRRYTFELRDDAFWSDGRPVTADDFVFTYQRALDPATGAMVAPALLDAVTAARAIRRGEMAPEQAGIHADGDHTLVIELAEPTSYFIYNLAYYVLLPVPRHVVEAHGAEWYRPDTIVTNGPFRLSRWEHGRSMVLERNPRYHGGARGNVQRVTLDLGSAAADHPALYLADEVDVLSTAWFTNHETISRLRRHLPDEYSKRDRFVTLHYSLEPSAPPLNDQRVRQAMAMAVDVTAIAAQLGRGLWQPATGGLVPPGMPGHVTGLAGPPDPATAAGLVSAAAPENSRPMITLVCWGGRAEPVARELQTQWTSVGLPTEICHLDPTGDPIEQWRRTEPPKAAIGGWVADYPDPDTFLRVCVELNLPDWKHDRYRALLERAGRATDPAVRSTAYQEAEQILAEEALIVPLAYEPEHLMLKPWVVHYPSIPVKYPGFWKDVVVGPR